MMLMETPIPSSTVVSRSLASSSSSPRRSNSERDGLCGFDSAFHWTFTVGFGFGLASFCGGTYGIVSSSSLAGAGSLSSALAGLGFGWPLPCLFTA